MQLPSSQDRSQRIANFDSVNSWLRSSFQFSNVKLTICPPEPQSSPSKIYDDQDLDSEVCLLYLFQQARAELFKTESSSTIHSPPAGLLPQPLTPDAKLRRLRAAAAISCERHAWALASSPIVSSTSQVCLLYLFQRTRAELLKTESSSTIRGPPPKLLPQPLTPDAKWRRLWAAVAMSRHQENVV